MSTPHQFQAVAQPYPLYCTALEVFRDGPDAGGHWVYAVETGLVVGWRHPVGPEGESLPAKPVLATAAGCDLDGFAPQEFNDPHYRARFYFADSPEESAHLAEMAAIRLIDQAERASRTAPTP